MPLRVFSLILFLFPYVAHASLESDIIRETNSERVTGNTPMLVESALLSQIAATRAARMAETQNFSHTDIDGHNAWYWLKEGDYAFTRAGENIAVNFDDAPSAIEKWMSSEGHRKNILNSEFKEIGVGVAEGLYKGATSTYIVQLFGTRAQEFDTQARQISAEIITQAAAVATTQRASQTSQKNQKDASESPSRTKTTAAKIIQAPESQREGSSQIASVQAPNEPPGMLPWITKSFINLLTFFW